MSTPQIVASRHVRLDPRRSIVWVEIAFGEHVFGFWLHVKVTNSGYRLVQTLKTKLPGEALPVMFVPATLYPMVRSAVVDYLDRIEEPAA